MDQARARDSMRVFRLCFSSVDSARCGYVILRRADPPAEGRRAVGHGQGVHGPVRVHSRGKERTHICIRSALVGKSGVLLGEGQWQEEWQEDATLHTRILLSSSPPRALEHA